VSVSDHTQRPKSLRLVVGYDGSDEANAAAAFAIWLAGKAGAEATLVHATPRLEAAVPAELLPDSADQAVAYDIEWTRRLENLREYATENARVHCRLVPGSPARALLDIAAQTRADVLLVGSHGVGRLRGALLGSVSAQVLTHASCSVMIFRETATSTPASRARTVIVGVDGSAFSLHALTLADWLAVALHASLVLLHAYDPHMPMTFEPSEALREELRRRGHGILQAARKTLAAPLDAVEDEIMEGRTRRSLLEACERHSPALLVVGSRGLGGFEELLVGSTSRELANHAPCPVLVARPREPSQQSRP
jgi:nucleotide-binding universal stress UspA family protein